MQSGTAVCGGGTKTALPGREPPSQFRLCRFFTPRADSAERNGL